MRNPKAGIFRQPRVSTALALITGIISMSLGCVASGSTVPLGTLTPFTGGDAGEGLDLDGDIIYAFNLGGFSGTETVQGVDFVDASVFDPPEGITTPEDTLEFDYTVTNADNAADYGDTDDDDALENVTTVIWYASNWTFDLDVVPGTEYQLQLILQEGWIGGQGTEIRNFDISVETASPDTLSLGVEELVLGIETNGLFQDDADFGLVYTYTFTATDDSFRVALDEFVAGSLAVLTAVTLEELGADTTPPGISTLNPANDDTGVPTASDLVVTFDENVSFGTGNITIKESASDAVVEAFDVTASPNLVRSGASVTIDPSSNLAENTGYYVQIDATAIVDSNDNFFTGITDTGTWSFTTGGMDVTAPALATLSPADDDAAVEADANLSITFDEIVEFGTGDITLRTSGGDLVEAFDVTSSPNLLLNGAGATVTIDPTSDLSAGTDYYVEIATTAIVDLAGNPFTGITGTTTWNFTTLSNVPLGTLTPFTGGDAGEGLDLSGNIVYAFNLGGLDGTQTVQGVDFVDASVFDPPEGITPSDVTLEFDYTGVNGEDATDYGDSASDDALDRIVNTVWYTTNWTFDLEVVPGTDYQLQLILQEGWNGAQGADIRNFDLSVETASPDTLSLAVDDLVLGTETNGAFQDEDDFGLVYSYTFTATDDSFQVALDDSPAGTDTNAILAAVILQEAGSAVPFAITEINHSAESVTLTWASRPGAVYVVESSPNMQIGWLELDDGVESGGEETSFEHTPDAGTTTLYYRVRIGQ